MSELEKFIDLIDKLTEIFDNQNKKSLLSYNKLFIKRFVNYYSMLFKNNNFISFNEIKKFIKTSNIELNLKYINIDDINFFNNLILNIIYIPKNMELNEFIFIYNIKEKLTNKNLFTQFMNDIKDIILITEINYKKLDDFYDNYELLLCNLYKQGETFNGPFIDVYKIKLDKINQINIILESYKIKKK